MEKLKLGIFTVGGWIGSIASVLLGGWTPGLTTLLIFMALDYITGLIIAIVFKKSPKTATGTLDSHAGFKGLCKKSIMLTMVLVGHRMDVTFSTDFVKNFTIYGLILVEFVSLTENWGLMGLYVPKVLVNMVDKLKKLETSFDNKNLEEEMK